MKSQRVAVVGLGAWGTAIAHQLAGGGHRVRAWTIEADVVSDVNRNHRNSKYLPGMAIAPELGAATDAEEVLDGARYVVWALPTQVMRTVATRLSTVVPPEAVLVSLAKGFELSTHARPTQILQEVLGGRPVAALLGPSHAEEVTRGLPTVVTASSPDETVAERVQRLFHGERFRVYRNTDLVGAESATALKNVIAVAAGISDGLGYGDNSKGALLTRGLAEMSRLGVGMGGRLETFYGLTGVGDLVTTSFSRYSRNRHVGEEVGKGRPLGSVLEEMKQVAEGVPTSRAAMELAREAGIEAPITEQVVAVLFENKSAREAMMDLMTREPRPE